MTTVANLPLSNMTPQAQELLLHLQSNYKKAAFYIKNIHRQLPEVATEEIKIPSDKWNQGSNHMITIPKGAKIRLVENEETYALGVGGPDTDQLKGLWVSEFTYGWEPWE
ncbi:MAG: hypothetical protein ACK4XN_04355 [Dolichospermum sp.]